MPRDQWAEPNSSLQSIGQRKELHTLPPTKPDSVSPVIIVI